MTIMNFRTYIVIGFVVLLSAAFLTGTSSTKPIKIGMLYELTGGLAEFGENLSKACNLAAEHINDTGGPLGRELKLVPSDTGTVPDQGVAATRKLLNIANVPALSGPCASAVAMASAPLVVKAEVPLVAHCATTPLLTEYEDNDFIFRTSATDAFQGKALAKLAKEKGHARISILARNDTFGRSLAKVLKDSFESLEGEVLRTVFYEVGQTSFKSELVKANQGDPDRISMIIFPKEGSIILKQAAELGITNFGLIPDSAKSQEMFTKLAEVIGKEMIEGINGVALATPTGRGVARYKTFYEEKYGEAPYVFSANAYDSVFVLALAIHKAGEATGPQIRNALREVANPPGEVVTVGEFDKAKELMDQGKEINYEGAAGSLDFDGNGDVYSPVGVWKIENGKIKEVKLYNIEELKKVGQ